MPASSKSARTIDSRYPQSEETQTVAEPDYLPARAGKKKSKNGATRPPSSLDHADDIPESLSMGQSTSPDRFDDPSSSALGQLPQTSSQNRTNNRFNALNDANASQKVSDEHTPPIRPWTGSLPHVRNPSVDPDRGRNFGTSPPYEPGFSTRNNLSVRSPPISPPMRNARPVSYGGGNPGLPSHHRLSTSPYGYGLTAYGSPPALPHLPQQHFYGAHDVDLGLQSAQAALPDPRPLRFASLPGAAFESRPAVLLAAEGEMHVAIYNAEKVEHVGALAGIRGAILDAAVLSWNTGTDPFTEMRPLVALVVHGPEESQIGMERQNYQDEPTRAHETRVVVYSLSRSRQIAELMSVPPVMPMFPRAAVSAIPATNLKLHTSGNCLVVSARESGEIFVFAIRAGKGSAVFECLGKYWTGIQPQLQRRDSSHGPISDADVSPADLGRGSEAENAPILSLNGRWLAFCSAGSSSRRSIGAQLGPFVVHNKNSNINSGTAPARPLVNCEVDSPDVETFLSKVAKGFAQEAVKGAKWISEKGMQTWQNYWKKESSSPSLAPLPSSSPPFYSPQLGLGQFPPTHATNQQGLPRDTEMVSILDLRLLQETQGRKSAEPGMMTTFEPPGGCSFLSIMPNGLGLFSANRKGDVQYVWDLLQMRYLRSSISSTSAECGRVRQIARYERLSPSTIVDLAWDGPTGYRFAVLTKNRTIHIFDLPRTALQWPPAVVKKTRPTSAPVDPARQVKNEHDPAPAGGFLASAMNIAGRTQPMLAGLRGRAPSINTGLNTVTPSALGYASTNTIKSGSRAVAAGFSKSLGAASETVTSIRHANQSRLHLRHPARDGIICWLQREGKSVLSILEETIVKNYYIRMTKPRENRHMETSSVFDAQKAVIVKMLKGSDMARLYPISSGTAAEDDKDSQKPGLGGFWKPRPHRDMNSRTPHPLASAEIETNTPYQPFHSDRRVGISPVTSDTSSVINLQPHNKSTRHTVQQSESKWVFGNEVSFRSNSKAQPMQRMPKDDVVLPPQAQEDSRPSISDAVPIQSFEEIIVPSGSNIKKKKAKKKQSRMLEEDDWASAPAPYDGHDRPFDPDEDLLVRDDVPGI